MDNLLKNIDIQSNPMIYGLLAVFLTLYGPRLHPKLPTPVRDLFNNNYFRFVIILLITYLSTNNLQAALLVSIAFCLLISYTNSQEVEATAEEHFRENYSNFDTIREFYEDGDDEDNDDEDDNHDDEDHEDEDHEDEDNVATTGDDDEEGQDPEKFEGFRNLALEHAEKAKDTEEKFNNPNDIIENAELNFNKNFYGKRKKEKFNNYEHFDNQQKKIPEVCRKNKYSKECLELCYASAGDIDKLCENVHPNPNKMLMLSKDCKTVEKSNEESTEEFKSCHSKEEKNEDFTNLLSMDKLDDLTKNIVEQVKKYKNMIL